MTFSVEMQPRDGGWVQLGTQQNGGYGVVPDSIEFDGDLGEYGPLAASFRLKLNPRWPRDIIEQFTPVVISQGAEHRWSGRVIAAPTSFEDGAEVVVQCQGWGQHTKDDCTDREWVIRDLSRWVDARNLPGVVLTGYTLGSQLDTADGAMSAKFGQGSILKQNRAVFCFTLDLGPNNNAKRIVFTFAHSGDLNAASVTLYARSHASADAAAGGTFSDAVAVSSVTPVTTTRSGTFSTGYRYVSIFMYYTGADGPFAADAWATISDAQVFTDAADESGNASILKAPTIISETLDACCPLISTDRSRIDPLATITTAVPNFPGSPGYRYANELIDQANSLHGYLARFSPDPLPVFEFSPLPTDYNFMVGAGEYKLAEPAAQDGRSVYSRVISEFEDATGVRSEAVSSPIANWFAEVPLPGTNLTFDTDVSGWGVTSPLGAASAGTVSRDTTTFASSPASMKLTANAGGDASINGPSFVPGSSPFIAGQTYRLEFMFQTTGAWTAGNLLVQPNIPLDKAMTRTQFFITAGAGWRGGSIDFVCPAGGFYITIGAVGSSGGVAVINYDSLKFSRVQGTLVDRRNFTRTALKPMSVASNATVAAAIANLAYANGQFPPFKGTLQVEGRIRTKGGGSMHVSALPSCVGDALLIENLTDPNTGALGRQGIIRTAKYIEKTDTAELTIDDPTGFLDIIVNRLNSAIR